MTEQRNNAHLQESSIGKAGIVCKVILVFLVLFGPLFKAHSQDSGNKGAEARSFIDSIAKGTYNLAWPTATYQRVSFDTFRWVESGYDVSVKLSGLSGIDGSDLWLKLVFEFRDGHYQGLRVLDHNGFFPPFFTTGTLLKASVYAANQYAENQSRANQQSSPPALSQPTRASTEAGCLVNGTKYDLTFQMKYDETTWKDVKVAAGESILLTRPDAGAERSSNEFWVRYLDGFTASNTERVYKLLGVSIPVPASCINAKPYHFGFDDGDRLVVFDGAVQR